MKTSLACYYSIGKRSKSSFPILKFSIMPNEIILIVFYFATLVYSIIIHEISHGAVALWLGDITAKYAGRLTLSPWSHIDPIGSILIPLLLIPTGFAFGYAKPVPYNPYNLRDQKWGSLKVAIAGPASNFLLAFIASLLASVTPLSLTMKHEILSRFFGVISGRADFLDLFSALAEVIAGSFPSIFFGLFLIIIFWNVVLGCFNLIPIPPLDGSKILFTLFPVSERTQMMLEQYGFFFLLFIVLFFSAPIGAFINLFLSLFLEITLW